MDTLLGFDSVVTIGKYADCTVNEVLEKDKKEIFRLIKKGLLFEDEVLSAAGIRKDIRDVKIVHSVVDHEKENKKYRKETMSVNKIIKELRTLEKNEVHVDNNAVERNVSETV